jgi:rod shape-determining protein MreC
MYRWKISIFIAIILLLASGIFWQGSPFYRYTRSFVVKINSPIARLGHLTESVISPFANIFKVRKLSAELESSRRQVIELVQKNNDLQSLEVENASLRRDLGLQKKTQLKFLPCSVLALGENKFVRTVTLDCGTSSGVSEGLGVVRGGVLIGTVSSVVGGVSTVKLLNSLQNTIDVVVGEGKNATVGVVRSSFGNGLVLDLVPEGGSVAIGDLVTSSGVNGQLVSGLVVGRVGEQISAPNDPQRQFVVDSLVDFQMGDYAVIVRP